MGFLDKFKSSDKLADKAAEEISKDYELGEIDSADCEGCSIQFPSNLSLDMDMLYNTAKKTSAQVLVFTGESNWKKDIGETKSIWGEVCHELAENSHELEKVVDGNLRINGCDLFDDDIDEETKVAVIILPQFARITTTPENCVEDVKKVLSVKPGENLPSHATPIKDRGFVLLCSHGKRDKRCGVTAPLMRNALNIELRHHELYRDFDDDTPGGIRVLFVNHVGGHKFAANALIYQNNGMALMLARVRPEYAKTLVEKTILQNIVIPELVRSCNKVAAYSW